MRKIFYLIASFFIISSAYSDDCKIDNINLYSTPHFYPFNYFENNQPTGAFIEIVENTLKESDKEKINIKLLPWARSYFMTKSNPDSLIFAIIKTKKRGQHLEWIGPLASSNFVIITKKEHAFKPITNIGALRESYFSILAEKYKQEHPEINIKTTNTIQIGFSMLDKGRIDSLIINHNLITKLIHEDKFSNYVIYKQLDQQNIYIAYNKKANLELISCFKKKIMILQDNGTIDKILEKYEINKPL